MKDFNIDKQRAIITNVRMRWAPNIQPIKQEAIERIIEQILFVEQSAIGLTLDEIQQIYLEISEGRSLNYNDIQKSIERLKDKKRVLQTKNKYTLSEEINEELEINKKSIDKKYKQVISALFGISANEVQKYFSPFIDFISIIFSKIGEDSIKLIKGEINGETPSIETIFEKTLNKIRNDFKNINFELFKRSITKFFEEQDPDYNRIKWIIAQNYYICKALGLNTGSELLSVELFENGIFYLDTNVAIEALEEAHRHHESFITIFKSCEKLNIPLKICQISLNELDRWLNVQYKLFGKVKNQIPEETAHKLNSLFYKIYYEKKKIGDNITIEEVFSNFNSPLQDLRENFDVEKIDDVWFDENKKDKDIEKFANKLRQKATERGYKRKKSKLAAKHDSLLIFWIQKERCEKTNRNIWLITTDRKLPGITPTGSDYKTLAITLDALVQWLSPLLPENENDFSTVFSKMIKNRLLPTDKFFKMEDFEVFHKLGMEAKALPPKDVEDFIYYLKKKFPELNLSNPEDIIKLHSESSKYFSSPDRKYIQKISELENTNKDLSKKYQELQQKSLTEKKELQKEFDKKLQEQNQTHQGEIENIQKEIKNLKRESYIKEQIKKWQKPAWIALFFSIIPILIFVFELFFTSWKYNYIYKIVLWIDNNPSELIRNLLMGLNWLIIVVLFLFLWGFAIQRLWLKDKIKEKRGKIEIPEELK